MFDNAKIIVHHAALAVDFFFALSGFVIAYAYDARWPGMTVGQFLKIRLVRLHPLLVLGTLLGLASYLFDPFAGGTQTAGAARLAVALVMSLAALPAITLAGRWMDGAYDTHPFNGPAWTLLQEYIGNIAYALVLHRLSTRALGWLAIAAAIGTLSYGLAQNSLDAGSWWGTWKAAPLRLAYPFLTGLWLYRKRDSFPRLRLGWLPLTLILATAFLVPVYPPLWGINVNGLYQATCVIALFPAIIVLGAHSAAGRGVGRLCRISGSLSYPLYITHFPFIYIWFHWFQLVRGPTRQTTLVGLLLMPFLVAVAWIALKFWDEPIRAYLRKRA